MKKQSLINDLEIKFSIIDYFSNKNISSREKNGLKKEWNLSSVLKISLEKKFILKISVFDGFIIDNKGIYKLIFTFSDGLKHCIECPKEVFEKWIKNLEMDDLKLLHESITDSKSTVSLDNKTNLESKNKVRLGL